MIQTKHIMVFTHNDYGKYSSKNQSSNLQSKSMVRYRIRTLTKTNLEVLRDAFEESVNADPKVSDAYIEECKKYLLSSRTLDEFDRRYAKLRDEVFGITH